MSHALWEAAEQGDLTIVQQIMEGKDPPDIDKGNWAGWTALFEASQEGHEKVVRYLLKRGADTNRIGIDGDAALHRASFKGFYKITKELIHHGATVNLKGAEGNTPLHEASRNSQQEIVSLLLRSGAKVNSKNNKQQTPLDLCCHNAIQLILSTAQEQETLQPTRIMPRKKHRRRRNKTKIPS